MAATVVDELIIKVQADMDDLRRQVERSQQLVTNRTGKMATAFKKVGDATRPLINRVAKLTVGLGGMAAAFVSVKAVIDSMNSVDSLGKTADKLGVTTEALQSLRLAAELTGVSAGTLDMALQRMVRRVAEAAQGTGEAVNALAELGLEATALARMSPDKQMEAIADAMVGVENQADRVRLAMKLFDSEGVALVNTLAGGSEALQQVAKDLEEMGAAISRVDAAKVEAANDALTKMKVQLGAISDTIAVDISAPLQAFVETLGDMVSEFSAGEDAAVGFGEVAETVFGALLDVLQSISKTWLGIQVAMNVFQVLTADTVEEERKLLQVGIKLREQWEELDGLAASTKLSIKLQELEYERLNAAARKQLETQEKVNSALEENVDILGEALKIKEVEDAEAAELDALKARMSERLDVIRDSYKSEAQLRVEAIEERLAAVREAAAMEAISAEESLELINNLQRDFNEANIQLLKELNGERAKVLKDGVTWEQKTTQDKFTIASDFFRNMSSLMNTESRKMFEIGKVAAIATAIVDTAAAVTKTMASVPYPFNLAAAASVGIAGAVQVANIKATQFGSGGGGTGVQGGGALGGGIAPNAPAATGAATNGEGGGGAPTVINATFTGGRDEQIRNMIELINEETDNNFTLNATGLTT